MGAHNTQVRVLSAFFAAISLAIPAVAQTATPGTTSINAALNRIHIDNFGRVNDNYYRGAQPKGSDYRDLAALGIKTVVDLQIDGPSKEANDAAGAGMKFFRIGMTTSKAPTDAQVQQFFALVNDPANQPVYVHCAGGRHRTGTMTALYRMQFDGWNAEQAYNEMKQYHFEGFPGHPVLRNYVYAYHAAPPKQPAVLATQIVTPK